MSSSISGLGSVSGSDLIVQQKNQIKSDFQQLGQDLQSGNLAAAQSDFATLQQDLSTSQTTPSHGHHHHHHHHGGGSSNIAQTSSSPSGPPTNSPAQLFGELAQDLQAGNAQAAQQAYSTLAQAFGLGSDSADPTSSSPVGTSISVTA
jgi:hypothetical protein